jgi:glycolate oxidase
VTASLAAALRERLRRGRFSLAPVDRVAYGYDASYATALPDAVVWPADAEEVAAVLALAGALGVPYYPRGAGTGLAGGSVPAAGGIALVLSGLRRPPRIDPENLQAEADAGVTTAELQAAAAAHGLLYPPDPSSAAMSTLGGNVATGAGGPRSFKYGTTKDYLLGLEAVLADGSLLRTGGRTAKNATGYDLTRLIAGSEGTLAVVTGVRVRLLPAPPRDETVAGVFADLRAAGEALVQLARERGPCAIELMDALSLRIVESVHHLGLPVAAAAVLIVEVDGWPEEVAPALARAEALLRAHGAEVLHPGDAGRGSALWRARKAISAAVARIKPTKVSEDVCVPRSAVPEMIARIAAIAARYDLILPVFGHAGDGNLHPNIVCDRRDADEMARVARAVDELFEAALALGGTLSGEHGVGTLKAPYLSAAAGPGAEAAMRAVKAALDPRGVLNPGKVLGPRGRFHG